MEIFTDKLKSIMDDKRNSRGSRIAASKDWVTMIFSYAIWKHCPSIYGWKCMRTIEKKYEKIRL